MLDSLHRESKISMGDVPGRLARRRAAAQPEPSGLPRSVG